MLKRSNTHLECTASMSTDCVTDGYADGRRAQYVMSRSCCICSTAKPCRWCWRPAVCELPVSYPAQQPASPRMRRWSTDKWWCSIKCSHAQWLGLQTTSLHVDLDGVLVTPEWPALWAFARIHTHTHAHLVKVLISQKSARQSRCYYRSLTGIWPTEYDLSISAIFDDLE